MSELFTSNESIIKIFNKINNNNNKEIENIIITNKHQINYINYPNLEKISNWTINPSSMQLFTNLTIYNNELRYFKINYLIDIFIQLLIRKI